MKVLKAPNNHIIFRGLSLLLCFCFTFLFLFADLSIHESAEKINVSVKSENNEIVIDWILSDNKKYESVCVEIFCEESLIVEKSILPMRKKYIFRDGNHGSLYTIRVTEEFLDGTVGETIEKEALFLDYSQLPDIPIISLNTTSGEDPASDIADKPDVALLGGTITNNDYVSGSMVMYGSQMKGISVGMKIRVRGNTSSIVSDKKSYKLHLDDVYDLLGNDEMASDEWVLLNNGYSINTYIGDYVGDLCGMEWQPHMMFVNVILNGDWKGCYCLTPAVNINNAGGLVSDEGYIFENDAYYWKPEEIYFKTENQIYQMGYTFKYPELTDSEDIRIIRLQKYMQEFENYLVNGDEQYINYIDEVSFAKWILVRDIIGTLDAPGSYIYYYKYDFDLNNQTSTKVKMGPLWDFDSMYATPGEWSQSRLDGGATYFWILFNQESFQNIYLSEWQKVSPDLYDNIKETLDELEETQGSALDESWKLESARWGKEITSFTTQKDIALRWFEERITWMDNELLTTLEPSVTID